jgi:GNAT superfamily N-acetyltransferase
MSGHRCPVVTDSVAWAGPTYGLSDDESDDSAADDLARASIVEPMADVATTPTLRRGTPDDARACHDLLWASATDLGRRRGTPLEGTADAWWAGGEALNQFLAEHAAEWWIAEADGAEHPIGYARSTERGGMFELTELFVRPGLQSRGVGRALIERAFPLGRGDVRVIIATTDVRATARYYAAGTVARFPYFTLAGHPRADARSPGGMTIEPIGDDEASMRAMTEIERAVLEFPRDQAEIRWLAANREGALFVRGGRPVGYSFVSAHGSGPIAALEPDDMPAILGFVEARAHDLGVERLELEVPGINEVAIRHLLGRRFVIDPWINLLMSSRPFGRLSGFIGYSPPIFL